MTGAYTDRELQRIANVRGDQHRRRTVAPFDLQQLHLSDFERGEP